MLRKSRTLFGLLILLAMALGACIQPLTPPVDGGEGEAAVESDSEEVTVYVGPTLMDCTGVGPQTCLLVKTEPDEEYSYFYSQIEGFDYVPGYEYELIVLVSAVPNPPADGSSLRYTLVEVVNAEEVGPTLENTPWQMTSVADENGQPIEALPDVEVTALFADGQLSGSGGCNSYVTSYEVEGTELRIDLPMAGTLMACPDPVMQQASAFQAALEATSAYQIVDNQLRLLDESGRVVATFAVRESASLTGTLWTAVGYNNGKEAVVSILADTEITAVFGEDGTLSGSAGCNNYTAGYEADESNITIGPAAVTMMMCPEPEDVMEQEALYLAALDMAQVYAIDGDRLQLRTSEGALVADYRAAGDEQLEDEAMVEDDTVTDTGTGESAATPAVDTGASATESAEAPMLEGTPWQMVSVVDEDGHQIEALPEVEVTALFEDGQVSGSDGCNNYSGSYTLDGADLAISPGMAMTMMACPDPIMQQASAYSAALAAAKSYEIVDSQLQLLDESGQPIIIYVVRVPSELVDTTWLATGYNNGRGGVTSLVIDTEITALFDAEGTLAGSAGCNNYTTSYEAGDETIEIGPAATTRKMCPEPEGVMEQENEYLAALLMADVYSIDGDTLELRTSEGSLVASFVAANEETAAGSSVGDEAGETIAADEQSAVDGSDVIGVEWHWFEFEGGDGQQIFVRDPSRYTLTLNPDGTAAVLADCNSGSGSYELEGSSLTINIVAVTMALCPPDSRSEDYLRLLGEVVTYVQEGDSLALNLMADAGNLRFQLEEATVAKAHNPAALIPQDAITVDPGPLATSYHWQVLPPTPYDASMPPVAVGAPPRAVVTYDYLPAPQALMEGGPYIVVYPVQEYIDLWQEAGNDTIAMTVGGLQALLAEQPATPATPLPILPPPGGVNDLATQIAYLDFGGGTAIRFLGRLSQDASPVLNPQLAYYAQGLTDDGRFYVSMRWPITTPALPANMSELTPERQQAISDDFDAYVQEVTATLDGLNPSDWNPNLGDLDALFASFELDVPAAE